MKFVNKKARCNSSSVEREKDDILICFVNKRFDCRETGIVFFVAFPRGGDACVSGDSTRTQR